MRALLINDASLLGHHGSALVTQRIVELGAAANIDVIHGLSWTRARRTVSAASFPFDIIIVNGEGSLHHDSQSAGWIADMAVVARERGIPAYLINATEEDNSCQLRGKLAAYRKIFLRDKPSQANLAQYGIEGQVVPDLSLSWPTAPRAGNPDGPILVTDASDNWKTARLIEAAANWPGSQMISFRAPPPASLRRVTYETKRAFTHFLKTTPRGLRYAGSVRTRDQLVEQYKRSRAIVCARYHSLCYAICMRLPFLAIDGNTAKCASLLSDIGIGAHRSMRLTDLGQLKTTPAIPPLAETELTAIDSFLVNARNDAKRMFVDIAADARASLQG